MQGDDFSHALNRPLPQEHPPFIDMNAICDEIAARERPANAERRDK